MSPSLTNTEKQVLRTLVPLSGLPDEQFEALCSTCRVHNGTPGTLLFQQGDRSSSFYYLLSGKISFSIGDIQVEIIESGSPSARFALAHQLPRKVTATALTTIRFIRLECEELEVSNREQPASSQPAKAMTDIASITELLLSNQDQSSISLGEPQICETEPSASKGFFKRLKTALLHRNSVKSAPPESSLSGNTANENSSPQSKPQQATEFQQPALPLENSPILPQYGGQDSSIQERGWKQSLPEETEKQLKAVILPLMQEIPDISASLIATEQGSYISPQFPKHRIERIKAIVQAAKNGVHDDAPDYPEEILLREKNSQIFIFLIETGGLFALHANVTGNLGLIRLEAYPIVIQIREIIALLSKSASVPSMP